MDKNQVLNDIRKNGKRNDWKEKKRANVQYSNLLQELEYKKASNVRVCAEVLQFLKNDEGQLKLKQAWFCKSRLCPMCNWRRSIKHSSQVIKIVDEAVKNILKDDFFFGH